MYPGRKEGRKHKRREKGEGNDGVKFKKVCEKRRERERVDG